MTERKKDKKMIPIEIVDATNAKVIDSRSYDPIWKALSYTQLHYKSTQPQIKSYLDRQTGKFPVGLIPTAQHKLRKEGYVLHIEKAPEIEDYEPILVKRLGGVKLTKYQRKAIREIIKHKRGIIIAPTASGKTILIASTIIAYDFPATLIIVPNRDVFYQTQTELIRLLKVDEQDIGLLGDSHRKIAPITIAMYQTLVRYDLSELNQLFDMVLVDEVQHSKCTSYKIIMDQLTNVHYRYGFTGTLPLKPEERLLIEGIFSKPIAIISEEEVSERVTPVDVYMIDYYGEVQPAYSYQISVKENIWLNKQRNRVIARLCAHAHKLKLSTIMLVEKKQQLEQIASFLSQRKVPFRIITGDTTAEERKRYKREVDNKQVYCLLATSAISTGTNIPNLEMVIIGSEITYWLNLTQKIGRGRRRVEGKDRVLVFDFYNHLGYTFAKQSEKKRKVYEHRGWFRERLPLVAAIQVMKEYRHGMAG